MATAVESLAERPWLALAGLWGGVHGGEDALKTAVRAMMANPLHRGRQELSELVVLGVAAAAGGVADHGGLQVRFSRIDGQLGVLLHSGGVGESVGRFAAGAGLQVGGDVLEGRVCAGLFRFGGCRCRRCRTWLGSGTC